MKLFTAVCLLCCFVSVSAQSGNVGVRTTSPTSSLTINGSIALGYRNITSPAYTPSDSDYFIAYSGSTAATFTLPAAVAGSGNFIGRIYKVKNNAGPSLSLMAATGEKISNLQSISIDSGSTAEIISTGSTTGTTWGVANLFKLQPTDNIRAALNMAGCASCARYDTAGTNCWVSITAAEYNNISSLSGIVSAGATTAQLAQINSTIFSGDVTFTQNSVSPKVLAASFPVALAIRTGYNSVMNMTGIKIKLSNTSLTSGYIDYPSASSTTSNPPSSINGNTVYYFVIKKPGSPSPFGPSSYVGLFQPLWTNVGMISNTPGVMYISGGDVNNPSGAFNGFTLQFQVLSTPNKLW